MKVLVIGSGSREHAIVWKLSQSKRVTKIYCCPGNAGIAELAECIDVGSNDFSALIDFAKYEWIDFTIVNDDKLLSKGIVNALKREGCKVLGPDRATSRLGASRVVIKNLLRLHAIPAPGYKVFHSYIPAQDYVRLKGAPIVIKADGTSAERGVYVASTVDDALYILRLIMNERIFGDDAGEQVIIEERLEGDEISFISFTDGTTIFPLTSFHKYMQIGYGNKGSYTAGMGAYSPAHAVTKELEGVVMERITKPFLKACDSEGIKFKGILSMDLIMSGGRPFVSEVNFCIGDPEAQTILPRLKTDFSDILSAITEERLSEIEIQLINDASLCVVASSKGYPERYEKGVVIKGLENVKNFKDLFLFHHRTSFQNADIVNTAGRVLSITAIGDDVKAARTKAYDALDKIHFKDMYYRRDIGE